MENKTEFRINAKRIRNGLDIENISQKLCEKIKSLEVYKHAQNVLIFYPLKQEVNVLSLLSNEKRFYLPRMNGIYLEICPYKSGDELTIANFGVKEPLTEAVSPAVLDLIILPALAVDKNNYRLGYGKGYYDRLLETSQATTIVPIPKELVVETLPIEPHDKKVDIVIKTN